MQYHEYERNIIDKVILHTHPPTTPRIQTIHPARNMCVKVFIHHTGKMAAVIKGVRAFQSCVKSIPLRQAISRTPFITATSIHHCIRQQDSRQFNTLTRDYKVKYMK